MKQTRLAIVRCLWLAASFLPLTVHAQLPDRKATEAGLPFVTWFSPQDYTGLQQVWSFVQDDRGILYAGHGAGDVEYDGTSWRGIATPHNGVVRALAKGSDGRIFVGESGDFGYLQPDNLGEMKFISLLGFVPKEDRDFQDIFSIQQTPEGIYFEAKERLFRLSPDGTGWRVKVWRAAQYFVRKVFYIYGTLYLRDGFKMQRVAGDTIETLPAAFLKPLDQKRVVIMLPYPDASSGSGERQISATNARRILVGTGDGSLFLMDESGIRPFAAESAGLLKRLGVSAGTNFSDGAIAIGTRTGGLLIMEPSGKVRRYLDRTAGIQSDGVLAVYFDRAGTLWMGLQNGIAKVEASSPLSEFGAASGMSASVNDIVRYRGVLYTGTVSGVRRLDAGAGTFQLVPGTESWQAFGFLKFRDSLLVAAANSGVFELTGTTISPVLKSASPYAYFVLAQSRQDPNRIWAGTDDGLASIRRDGSGRWIDEGMVAKCPTVRSIVETEPGSLWLGTESQGVVRVRLDKGSLRNPKVQRFGKADGLGSDGAADALLVAGRVIFLSPGGVREFDSASGRFIESKKFGKIPTNFSTGGGTTNQGTDEQGNVWIHAGVRPVYLLRQDDGTFRIAETAVRRIGDGQVYWLFRDDDGVLWLAGNDGMFRYDPSRVQNSSQDFATLLRRVTVERGRKSVLYAGDAPLAASAPRLAYRDNALRFEYTATSFEDPSKNQFQSKLEGFDSNWSAPTTETRRDYTNLPPGPYDFRVKSTNVLMKEGSEAKYSFEILPPWYRTWWAYGLYVLLLAGALFAADRGMRRRVIARERNASEGKRLQAEVERKRNVELLSEIGKELTSSLEIDTIFVKLYDNVNQLMDAAIFGVGVYHPDEHSIEYRLAFENGKRYEPYRRDTQDKDQFPVWCIDHRKTVFVNDIATEYSRYIQKYDEPANRLEDGSLSQNPQSLIYLPLMAKDRVLGIITVQSFKQNAYTDYHLSLLESLAAYTSIALDNADAYEHLKSARDQLVVQEKLASLGALTAGIAHEIKNPLNFVNNFADLSVELMGELGEELEKQKPVIPAGDYENLEALLGDISGNAKKINEHGKRADGIVRSMLLHSRGQAGERQPTDINSMLDEYVNLAYHGMRAQDSAFNVTIAREYGRDVGTVDAIPQDLSRVFLNLLNNACYAAGDRAKRSGADYKPTLLVRSVNLGNSIEVRIRDNGMGIPAEVLEKIFNPFFTTKPTGQGTGLGLSISHDIVVQGHGGQLEVATEPGEYTEFVVRLPRHWRKAA